ncbi:MAG: hypothetical protein ABJP02_05145 [Parasphingorhabdus sp.]|uniref:hypothetical protein n=1 Tax=Parasphingorhabdus sp. TaxID=2709688 RepID=UPI003299A234
MTKLIKTSAMAIAMISLAACSGDPEAPEAETVTETRMDEVDVIDGTISDDMVDVDAEETGDQLAEGESADEKSDEDSEE